jgi:hypothetical protein
MPVEHAFTLRAGTTAKLLLLYAAEAAEGGSGKTGLASDMPGASAAYIREGQTRPQVVTLVPGRLGEWAPGSFVETDAELMPGVYQFGAPDEMLAGGSARVLLLLRFRGATIKPIEINLVAYDPQDAERIGVWSLANSTRHEFLRQALPRFTEMELALGQPAEQALRENLRSGR